MTTPTDPSDSTQPPAEAPEDRGSELGGAEGSAFGIVANCGEPDRVLRLGAKCWLVGGTGGEGFYKFQWWGMARNGHMIEKWCPTERFTNFRAAWITPAVRRRYTIDGIFHIYMSGTRAEMEDRAKHLTEFRAKMRPLKPKGSPQNIAGQTPKPAQRA